MYLVFIGNDYTIYTQPILVFYSLENALDYAVKSVQNIEGNKHTDEYIKSSIKESFKSNKEIHGISRGVFYTSVHYDMFNDAFVGIEKINVGDSND